MLVAITDIYYSMFILLALLPLLMIKNSLFVVMVVRVGKISISGIDIEKTRQISRKSRIE
jgi:hypothetical protein